MTEVTRGGQGFTEVGVRRRVDWLDAARGFAVVAVVLYHVSSVLVDHYDLGEAGMGRGWRALGYLLSGVRLPLLLTVSGAVLGGQVRRGFGRSTTGFRVVQLGYLYLLWTTIYWVVLYRDGTLAGYLDRGPATWLGQVLVPATPVWFLAALALYVLLATATRRLPPAVVLLPLAVLSAWAAGLNLADFETWRSLPQYAVFFVAGVYGAQRVRRIDVVAGWRWWLVLTGGAATFTALMVASRRMTPGFAAGAVEVVGSFAGVVAVLMLIERACRWERLRAVAVAVGRRTIGVYLASSLLFLALLHLTRAQVERWLDVAPDLSLVVLPPVVTVVLVVLCLVLEQATRRVGLGALWQLPRPVAALLGRGGVEPLSSIPRQA